MLFCSVCFAHHTARPLREHGRSRPAGSLPGRGCLVYLSKTVCLHAQVILFGYNHDNPTADYAEFLDFAASLAAPDIYDMLKSGTPLTPVMRCE